MGLYATMRRASAADVARLRAEPALVDAFLHGDQEPAAAHGGGIVGFLRRLVSGGAAASDAGAVGAHREPTWPHPADGQSIALDKAWHGLHYLFTRSADEQPLPAGFLLSGGEDIGADDADAMPRLLDPAQVRAIADFLAALDADELTRRFDPTRMTELDIYPAVIWHRREDPDEAHTPLGWLLGAFDELQTFARAAASAGDAVVVSIS